MKKISELIAYYNKKKNRLQTLLHSIQTDIQNLEKQNTVTDTAKEGVTRTINQLCVQFHDVQIQMQDVTQCLETLQSRQKPPQGSNYLSKCLMAGYDFRHPVFVQPPKQLKLQKYCDEG